MLSSLFPTPESNTVVLSTLEDESMFVFRTNGISFRFNPETNEYHPFCWRYDSGVMTLSFDAMEYKMKVIEINGDILKCKVQSFVHSTKEKDLDDGEFEIISRRYEDLYQFPALRFSYNSKTKIATVSLLSLLGLGFILFWVFS